MISFFDLARKDLEKLLLPLSRPSKRFLKKKMFPQEASMRQARLRAAQIFRWVYKKKISRWDAMSDLSKEVLAWAKEHLFFETLKKNQVQESQDGTCKFLWELQDGNKVESVWIPTEKGKTHSTPHNPRYTLCISSQVGCAMKCAFCLTGKQGFKRNLTTSEIISQVHQAAQEKSFSNIVFMGMGEPLLNFKAVVKACKILMDDLGMGFSKRKITVSTSGVVPKMGPFLKEVDISLAVSLNATLNNQRNQIMPINQKWNIQKLLKTCQELPLRPHRKITFEYVLISNFNDSLEDANRLVHFMRAFRNKLVNIIPLNPSSASSFQRPTDQKIKQFQHTLISKGITATVRISKGRDILAACGQLYGKNKTAL